MGEEGLRFWQRRDTRLLMALVLLGVLARFAAVLPWDLRTMLDGKAILVDDSFYSLALARNLVRGLGMTADGVHQTNGFQPAYVFLCVPLYALGALLGDDQILPVYLAQAMLAVFNALVGVWVFRLARRASGEERLAVLATLAWMLWPYGIRAGVNGLETSLAAFMVGWVLWFYVSRIRERAEGARAPDYARLGVLLGLALWARMDTGLLALVLGLDMLLSPPSRPFAARFKLALVAAAASAVVFLPWLAISLAVTGDWFPVSGKAVRQISVITSGKPYVMLVQENIIVALAALLDAPILPDWKAIDLPGLGLPARGFLSHRWTAGTMLVMNGAPLLLGLLLLARTRRELLRAALERAGFLVVYVSGAVVIYASVVLGIHYFYRYLYPLLFLWLPLAAWLVSLARQGWPRRALLYGLGLIFAVNAGLQARALVQDHAAPQFFTQVDGRARYEEPVAAFQTGTFSYFYEGAPVINLDGVVNRDAYEAVRDRRLCAYLKEKGIRTLADFPAIIRGFLWNDDPPCRAFHSVKNVGGLDTVKLDLYGP